jgi:hypothetical protein
LSKVVLIILLVLVVIIAALLVISAVAEGSFNKKVMQEVSTLFQGSPEPAQEVITKEDLAGLPGCVQKWLEYSQIIGKEQINTVRLQQRGEMRLQADAGWMPFQAVQYFRVDKPGFIWQAKIKPAPLVSIVGRDIYFDGQGQMLIKPLALFTAADAKGQEMDQGALMRYFAEMQWFPSAALSNYITWEEVDQNSAQATITYQGVTASAVFTFDEQGRLVDFSGERYMEAGGKYTLETWGGSSLSYGEFQGIKMASKGQVTWKLKTGDFTWLKWEIIDIEYNIPSAY